MLGARMLQAAQEAGAGPTPMQGWAWKVRRTIAAADVPTVVHLDETVLPSEMLDAGSANSAQPRGGDIRVTSDEAGTTLLPHVVVYFRSSATPAERNASIYVRPGAATDLWIWYANPDVSALPEDHPSGANAVWDADLVIPVTPDRVSQDLSGFGRDGKPGILRDFNSVLIFDGATEYAAWPSIARAADGRLLCAFRRGAAIHGIDMDGYISVHHSADNGMTWSELSTINQGNAATDSRDPNLLVRSNGDVWCVYTERADSAGNMVYRVSADNGATWGAEQAIVSGTRQAHGKPIELANGNIALSIYDWGGTNVAYYYQWDGAAWSSQQIASGYNETSVLQDPNAETTLYAFLRGASSGIYRSVSTDGGSTWGAPSKVLANVDAGPAEPQWRDNGDLLLCYADDRANAQALVVRSTDQGATFSSSDKVRIAQDGDTLAGLNGEGFYPSFVQLSDGLYGAAFYHDTDSHVSPTKILFRLFRVAADGRLVAYTDLGTPESGVAFDGAETHLASIGDLSSFAFMHTTGSFTIRGVMQLNDHTADIAQGLITSVATSKENGFALAYENRSVASADRQLRLLLVRGVDKTPAIDASSPNGTIVDNNPHLIHVTGDGPSETVRFYVDGTEVGNVVGYSGLGSGNASRVVNIGRWNHSAPLGYLNGRWHQCAVYDTPMGATEIGAEHDNWANMAMFWDASPVPQAV